MQNGRNRAEKPSHASTAPAPSKDRQKSARKIPVRCIVSESEEKRESDGKAERGGPSRARTESALVAKVHQLTTALGYANYQIRRLTTENAILRAKHE